MPTPYRHPAPLHDFAHAAHLDIQGGRNFFVRRPAVSHAPRLRAYFRRVFREMVVRSWAGRPITAPPPAVHVGSVVGVGPAIQMVRVDAIPTIARVAHNTPRLNRSLEKKMSPSVRIPRCKPQSGCGENPVSVREFGAAPNPTAFGLLNLRQKPGDDNLVYVDCIPLFQVGNKHVMVPG